MFNYDSIISLNKGRFIYIDFWASWCIPCRSEVPDSKKMRELYRDKKITFIYISIDKDIDKWKNAIKEEDLDGYQYNYILKNPSDSRLPKKFKIENIPRYILLDTKGNVLYLNAPRPNESRLKSILGTLLK